MKVANQKISRSPLIAFMLFMTFGFFFSVSIINSSPANAAPEFGGGVEIGPAPVEPCRGDCMPPPGQTPPGGVAPAPAPGAGGGGSAAGWIEWGNGMICGRGPTIDGVTYPPSLKMVWKQEFIESNTVPNYGRNWVIINGGIVGIGGRTTHWVGEVLVSSTCVPQNVSSVTYSQICNISVSVRISQTAPRRFTDPAVTTTTIYREGSRDWNACVASASTGYRASVNKPITQYGYYELHGHKRQAVMTKKVTTAISEQYGVSTREQISLGPAHSPGGWYWMNSLSMDCKNGARSPGVMVSDWTEQPCQGTNSWSSHRCEANPLKYNTADGTGTNMKSVGTSKIQFLRDGKAREMVFDQRAVGPNLRVTGYKTKFVRSADSTPWDASKSVNNNLFSLSRTASGSNILTYNGETESPVYNSKVNNVFASGYYTSEYGKPTKITQQLMWSGTRTMRSVAITGVTSDGRILFTNVTIQVPTSGVCSNTGTIDYTRAIGHESGS